MAVDPQSPSTNRPYGAVPNILEVLRRIRTRNLPERIDRDFLLAAGIPAATTYRSAFALEFLGLVDADEVPTEAARQIAISTDEEYQTILLDLLHRAYRDVFAVYDPAKDPPERIAQAFRRYNPASARDRMLNFFLGMCREAGIPVLDTPRPRPSAANANPKPSNMTRPKPKAATEQPIAQPPLPPLTPHVDDRSEFPPALELLIRILPQPGSPMTAEQRKHWITMAEAALGLIYPLTAARAADPVGSVPKDENVEGASRS
jgi:hypothetical protein